MLVRKLKNRWQRFWMQHAGLSPSGRFAAFLAALTAPPYKGRVFLAHLTDRSFIAPSASLSHPDIQFAASVFIGDRVVIYQAKDGGRVSVGRGSHIHSDVIIETGSGGRLVIGTDTHIQPRCQFSAYCGDIAIGNGVQIAPNCSFYPYSHGMKEDSPIKSQPLSSRGGITIEDDAWLGVGVIVLDGVTIGKGAVVGGGSVVTKDIPAGAIAAGGPAKVLKMRGEGIAAESSRE